MKRLLWLLFPGAAALAIFGIPVFVLILFLGNEFGDAEQGVFHPLDTPDARQAKLALYKRLEAESVPGFQPGSEEWKFRVPWELLASVDKLKEVADIKDSTAPSLAPALKPVFSYEDRRWETISICKRIDKSGKPVKTYTRMDGIVRLLVRAEAWAGTLTRRYEDKTVSWASGNCNYTVTSPELAEEFFDTDFSRLDAALVSQGMNEVFDRPLLLGLMSAYEGKQVDWTQLAYDGDMLPASQAGTGASPGSVGDLIKRKTQGLALGPAPTRYIRPAEGPVTSAFGWRVHPILGVAKLHTGMDIGVGDGAPVLAAADGLVLHSGWLGGYGNAVIVAHGGGEATLYAHLQVALALEGMRVSAGQEIGRVDSTGMSTGPHLHFELRQDGVPVDPGPRIAP